MFWNKKKAREAATDICHVEYANLDLRRAVLDWRDRHIENVEHHLTRELAGLYRSLDQQLETMSMRDLFNQVGFGKGRIEPIYKEWVTREVTQLSRAAQNDLSTIFIHALEFGEHAGALDQKSDSGHYTDAALAAAAVGAGIAVIPTFATMSVISVGGIMGLLGATTIALPVAAAGIATVGTLLALGGYKAASLKTKAIGRYRNAITQSIQEQVLGSGSDRDSICHRLQLYIQRTAEKIIIEIDQC